MDSDIRMFQSVYMVVFTIYHYLRPINKTQGAKNMA